MLIDADEEYLASNLGLDSVSELQRLRFEISKVLEKSVATMNIYGWGSN